MGEKFCQYISELAIKSMLYEVSATPKPGLVDRNNAGAHQDMDYYSFMASSAALGHTFYQCALEGLYFYKKDFTLLLDALRPIGIEGERKMFEATGGVNTHKGLIFSLGMIAAAAGTIDSEGLASEINAKKICQRVMEITKGISNRELGKNHQKQPITYGERLFEKYGIKGIRGEIESGFITVRRYGLPMMKKLKKEKNIPINDICVQVLLHLMTVTEDSNVLGRHNLNTLGYVQDAAKKVLRMGGIFTKEGRKNILDLDEVFIERNISPGGAADLLAITIMLFFLDEGKQEVYKG
ncbi:triphosphoribosyl-dephospho-CoA synthase CitG [Clostridiaceae bacterium 35-E11]